MKNFLSFLVLGILALSFFGISSCSKDDEKTESKTEILTTGSWKISTITVNGIDFSNVEPFVCRKDDVLSFSANGTYIQNNGTNKCDPDEEPTYTGTWEITANETKLVMDDELEFTMVEVKSTYATLSTIVLVQDQEMTAIFTFIH